MYDSLRVFICRVCPPEMFRQGVLSLALKEVVGVDIGPSSQQRNVDCLLQVKTKGDFCPSYLFFKEDCCHEQTCTH